MTLNAPWIALILAAGQLSDGPDIILADFEQPTYGAWTSTGEAFGTQPARGALPHQMAVSGFLGKSLANSFVGGDAATGKLTSPQFEISRDCISFLIGGGGWPDQTCMNLLVDGKRVRTATGPNQNPGGSEALERVNWNVAEFKGRKAVIEIVDQSTGGWGHINVDHIVLTDQPQAGIVINPKRELLIEKRGLHIPIKNAAPLRRLKLAIGENAIAEFEAAITEAAPDFWAFIDVSPWLGKRAQISAERLPADGIALEKIEQSDELKGDQPVYQETLRPQFHFSSRRGWLNDPNGLVYADGLYHMYFQHNPYGWSWGNMHWGHAVSKDLLRWVEQPIAIRPRSFGDWAYSGSAVVDAENTSGWKRGHQSLIVGAYTSTGRGECIVYSNDGGQSFVEFEGNPVVTHTNGEGRDPRLLWHAATKRWVMAVYDEDGSLAQPDRQGIAFYTSQDLKRWTFRSRIGGFFECPDLFELPVIGAPGISKWVLTAANSEYMLGSFDGEKFTPDEPGRKLPGNRSDRFYAAQTFSNAPDGRRIQIGWARIDSPGMPFNQMMSFPCELTLRKTPDGVRLFSWPIRELKRPASQTWSAAPRVFLPHDPLRCEGRGDLLDVVATLDFEKANRIELRVRGMALIVDKQAPQLACGDQSTALPIRDNQISLRVLADRTSLEVFANQGEVAMLVAGKFSGDIVEIKCSDGAARALQFEVNSLQSIWGPGW